jgi:tryptophan-rich sensory protein
VRLSRPRLAVAAGTVATAVAGGLATDPRSDWFTRLDKPRWYPPPATFGVVWTALYAGLAWSGGELLERSPDPGLRRALTANLALNAAWTPLFFRAHRPAQATAECAALAVSTADLVRRARPVSRGAAAALAPYAAWTAFATALSGSIARRNRRVAAISPSSPA